MTCADDFPYKCHSSPDIADHFRELAAWRPRFVSRPYAIDELLNIRHTDLCLTIPCRAPCRSLMNESCKPMIMIFNEEDRGIADYFTEHQRVRAARVSIFGCQGNMSVRESVYEYWTRAKDEILYAAKQSRMNPREIISQSITEVSPFRPTIIAGLMWFLRAQFNGPFDYILDPSSGWGERMIGALAANARGYISSDPNENLVKDYERMTTWIRDIHPSSRSAFVSHFCCPFEDVPMSELLEKLAQARRPNSRLAPSVAVGKNDGYDLALACLPYHNQEIYVAPGLPGSAKQSTLRYRTFREWYSRFFIASLAKCAGTLRIGGVLATTATQVSVLDPPFIKRMFDDVIRAALLPMESRDRGVYMRYLGPLSFTAMHGNICPIWIWIREE